MNSHQPVIPQVQPAIPISNGRPGHNVPYTPSPHPPPQAHFYPGYHYQYPLHFQRPPQQWTPYPVPMPVGRSYQPYPPMTQYPLPQHLPPMRPSPQQAPSTSPIHPVQGILSPSSSTTSLHVPSSTPIITSNPHLAPPTPPPPPPIRLTSQRTPFYPPLPWQSFEGTFPPRGPRRRRRPVPQSPNAPVELPSRRESLADTETVVDATIGATKAHPSAEHLLPESHIIETPSTSHAPSEALSTQPTTPSSAIAPPRQTTPKNKPAGRPTAPVHPIIPAIPNIPIGARPPKRASASAASDVINTVPATNTERLANAVETAASANEDSTINPNTPSVTEDTAVLKPAPKSWADLVRSKGQPTVSGTAQSTNEMTPPTNGFGSSKSGSLAGALSSYSVQESYDATKIAFLEPRGLVNTGNMCYMNSILQILVFCVPFYTFLETIGNQAAHNFKSDTPLMDAMIMFMREFRVIDAAASINQLRMRLKDNELEQYGGSFIPEFVYEVIRRLPRFSSMRRGHQQDAEEFLGFVLEEMHDECSRAMKAPNPKVIPGDSTPINGVTCSTFASNPSEAAEDAGWLEVGPRQRSVITRSSGVIATESPVTKIFGGKLRSELRVPGMKNSVTLEPYQPLQLDIGSPQVSNIIDALKGLTKSETLHGDFNSPRGPGSTATKQVTIETLPQVLILHLKRFQYDNAGGTQKIWKKVGYPLDLEIPKEVFPQHKRGGLLAHGGLPKYRLIGVVYHHGKNASGGHYTVDVRRQEGREWIRIDDTIIRRIRSEDVAEGGSEEDPQILAAALEQHNKDQAPSSNLYGQFAAAEEEEQKHDEKGWNQVNGTTLSSNPTNKKWSGVANGIATPTESPGKMTPIGQPSAKDSKVAYILFYQKVN